jgi:two-component system cell cycle response regulator
MSGRVLLVADLATNRIALKAKLAHACYEVIQAAGGVEAMVAARRESPDVIVMDARMPGIDGIACCAQLGADPATRSVPVVLVAASGDRAAALQGLAAGAEDILHHPIDEAALLARMRNLMREKAMRDELAMRSQTCRALGLAEEAAAPPIPEAAMRVEVICADPRVCQAVRRALAPQLPARIDCLTPRRALESRPEGDAPDLVIAVPSATAGPDLAHMLPDLRSRPATRNAAILALLPDGHTSAAAAAALDLGANACSSADADAEELALRVQGLVRRKRDTDRLRASLADGLRLAVTDPLTGLYNRRYAQHHLNRIAMRAAATGGRYALMLLDVDRFKSVNDRFGHAAGDAVLAEVAGRLRDNLRGIDLLSRHGGEEFLAALPDTTAEEARTAAERLRRIVAETPFQPPGHRPLSVTLSVGVAMGGGDHPASVAEVLRAADRALYESKNAGRNLVCFARAAA